MLILAMPLYADEPANKADPAKSVADIAKSARKSLVVVLHTGRDGKQNGLGTGFVVAKDGLIATNLHVIGEGRPITVQFPDGKRHQVTGCRDALAYTIHQAFDISCFFERLRKPQAILDRHCRIVGSVNQKVAPWPRVLSMPTRPPCC